MNDKYFYLKNGHTYIIEGEVRMKDISIDEWYDWSNKEGGSSPAIICEY